MPNSSSRHITKAPTSSNKFSSSLSSFPASSDFLKYAEAYHTLPFDFSRDNPNSKDKFTNLPAIFHLLFL